MMILDRLDFEENARQLSRARGFALEHLVVIHGASSDLRWALLALAWRSVAALWVMAQARLVRNVANRQKAPFQAGLHRC